MTWLLNEDRAIKQKFADLTVSDANAPAGGRKVLVRYADPEVEFGTLTFPLVLINRLQLVHMPEREHRGHAAVTYWPDGVTNEDDSRWDPDTAPRAEIAVPMDIVYQISVQVRRASHQMELAAKMALPEYLPARFGYLEVPEDGSTRSLFVDAGPEYESGKGSDGKRLLQAHYNIRVATEIPPSIVQAAKAATIDLSVGLKQ